MAEITNIDNTRVTIQNKFDEFENRINDELKKIQDEQILRDEVVQHKFDENDSKHYNILQRINSDKQDSIMMLSFMLSILYAILLNPVIRFINKFTHTYTLGMREIHTTYFGTQFVILVSIKETAVVENQTVFSKKYKELLKSGRKTKDDIIEATVKYQMGGYEISGS